MISGGLANEQMPGIAPRHRDLEEKGMIAPQKSHGRKMANFLTAAVVAHTPDFDRPLEKPRYFSRPCCRRLRRFEPQENTCPGLLKPSR